MYTLTEEGRAYVTEHADELKASWDAVTGSVDAADIQLKHLIHQVIVAVSQVAQAGSAAQVQQAGKILADTRRALYRILAADGEENGTGLRRGDFGYLGRCADQALRRNRGGARHRLRGGGPARPSASSARTGRVSPPPSRSCAPWRTRPRVPPGWLVMTWSPNATPCAATSAWYSRTPPWTAT